MTKRFLVGVLTVLPWVALASDDRDGGNGRKVPFIGVFHPVVTGISIDPARCPEASHPFLFSFQGEAYTTVGRATFEQSHCEGVDHTSFRRGEQTITFATGDKLFGAYSGLLLATPTTATDGRLIIDGTYRNLGGTGRLTNAGGRGVSAGVVDTSNSSAEVTVTGTL